MVIHRRIVLILALGACLPLISFRADAQPTGGQVVAGQATITGGANLTNITQETKAAIIDWRDFSIGRGETVRIRQSGPDAALLNRVVGANPSALLGQLQANGRVYLVNPNGVLVGKDARIDAGAFLATTARVGNAQFMAGGDLRFAKGTTAGIVNLGVIKATHGDAVLVACHLVNRGEIRAPHGTAALAACHQLRLCAGGRRWHHRHIQPGTRWRRCGGRQRGTS